MLNILWEDAHCLAIDKPAGLAVQGRRITDESLEAEARHHLAPAEPSSAYLGIVHRLDRPVSGVLLWAKTTKAARRLAEQFASRAVEKEYHAVVAPPIHQESATWEDFLYEEDTGLGRVQVCRPGTPRARRAVTRMQRDRAAQSPDEVSRLILRPETGRTHQLRVQSASRGHPILGDALYGSVQSFPNGIALHAAMLTFAHPITEQRIAIKAPHPPSWTDAGFA